MNTKRAKRIKQLVNHLQASGRLDKNMPWVQYVDAKNSRKNDTGTRHLDPKCGRAVYQLMKKNAMHSKTSANA